MTKLGLMMGGGMLGIPPGGSGFGGMLGAAPSSGGDDMDIPDIPHMGNDDNGILNLESSKKKFWD